MPQPDSGHNCCDCPQRTSPCDDCGGGTGACCIAGVCSILSESDCTDGGGNYLGNDSVCDGVDCTQGACCFDTDCEIFSNSDCTDFGGIYQGDGTVCTPVNPCVPGGCCGQHGFVGFVDSSTRFLTHIDDYEYRETRGAPFDECTTTMSHITTTTYDLSTCVATVTCSGGGSRHFPTHPEDDTSWNWVSFMGSCHGDGAGPTSCNPNCLTAGAPSVIDNTTTIATCDFATVGYHAHLDETVTLSDQCTPTGGIAPGIFDDPFFQK